jgi:hypothetical protein
MNSIEITIKRRNRDDYIVLLNHRIIIRGGLLADNGTQLSLGNPSQ